jgi:hypothetical protein
MDNGTTSLLIKTLLSRTIRDLLPISEDLGELILGHPARGGAFGNAVAKLL